MEVINQLPFNKRQQILKDLSEKIYVIGSDETKTYTGESFIRLAPKRGANTNNVKSILRNFFDIEYGVELDWHNNRFVLFAQADDIRRLCKIYLENNLGHLLEYYNRFDPMMEKPTIKDVVYQYGQVRYDLV